MSRVVTPVTSQPIGSQAKIPHDKIAMRAYEKWIKKGRPQGTHEQDWMEAETELRVEMNQGNQTYTGSSYNAPAQRR
jgi:hypothetical protein